MSKAIEVASRVSFADLPGFVKELADKGLETISTMASMTAMMSYDLGCIVHELTSTATMDEAKKKAAVQQVSACWSTVNPALTTAVLYGCRQVAVAFDREWFLKQVEEPKKNGSLLSFSYFRELQKVKDKQEIKELLALVRQQNLSHRELRQRIEAESKAKVKRSGGRKVKIPTRPQDVFRKLAGFLQLTNNFTTAIDDAWVEKAKTTKEPQVVLENLNKALAELDKMAAQTQTARIRLAALQLQLYASPAATAAKPAVMEIKSVVKKRGRSKKVAQ